ncbi:unnamed protein product, partial [Allacma fusca]
MAQLKLSHRTAGPPCNKPCRV